MSRALGPAESVRLIFRVTPETALSIEEARGQQTLSKWMRDAIEAKLERHMEMQKGKDPTITVRISSYSENDPYTWSRHSDYVDALTAALEAEYPNSEIDVDDRSLRMGTEVEVFNGNTPLPDVEETVRHVASRVWEQLEWKPEHHSEDE